MHGRIIHIALEQKTDWIPIVISIAVPFLIMLATLWYTKWQQDRIHRLTIIPIFDVVKISGEYEDIKSNSGDRTLKTNHVIDISLKNVGSGTATYLSNKWIEIEDKSVYFPAFESPVATYSVYKEFSYDSSIAPTESVVNTKLIRTSQDSSVLRDNLIIEIRFHDLMGNSYKQIIGFSFFIDTDTGALSPDTITPIPPTLLKRGGR